MNDQPERLEDMLFRRREEQRKQRRDVPENVTPLDDERRSRYATRALADELDKLSHAPEGQRNDQLNASSFNLAQLCAADALDENVVRDALASTARTIGLAESEISKTIASGFRAGAQQPRQLPADDVMHRSSVYDFTAASSDARPEELDTQELHEFWQARELLTHIEQSARARRASPWAVLGVVLARVVTCTPPTVVLPPLVGGDASLNMFVGLVGISGAGKGAAERVANHCLQLPHVRTLTTGSGEGIAHAYKTRKGGEVVWNDDEHAVLFSVPEIDTLSALGSRQGATLMPELRRGWSGEALGFQYVDSTRRLLIEEHQYRLCLVAGIQPARAKALLDDADGGTPQRFVWLPTTDTNAPDVPPETPKPMRWHAPVFARSDLRDGLTGRYPMTVPKTARDTIDSARLARLRGDAEALDGHLLLAQLKLAAALAIADTRLDISDDDWQLAELITRKSTAVRAGVAQALEASRSAKNRARAEGDAERALIVEDKQADAARARVQRRILSKLSKRRNMSGGELKRCIAARDRGVLEEAIDMLVDGKQLVAIQLENGYRYELP